jgi:DMSO reductase anchor subunit
VLVPGAFDSSYTVPTTRYLSRRGTLGDAQPADAHRLRLEPAHGPLLVMLVLTQASAGMLAFLAAADAVAPRLTARAQLPILAAALAVLLLGLAASTLHLGRPLGAWRFFLGLRTSWMSREILAFGLFAAAAAGATAAAWLLPASPLVRGAVLAAAVVGTGAVFTSVMIYVDTRRALWRLGPTLGRFFGTFASVGLLATGLGWFWFAGPPPAVAVPMLRGLAVASLGVGAAIHGGEQLGWRRAFRNPAHPAHASALVVRRHLGGLSRVRTVVCGVTALLLIGSLGAGGGAAAAWLAGALLGTVASALLERYVFFTAVVAYRMPGGV